MNKSSLMRVLSLGALGLSLFTLAGCSQRTQAVNQDSALAEAPSATSETITSSSTTEADAATPKSSTPGQPENSDQAQKAATPKAKPQKIDWQPSLTTALNQAKRTQKPIMVDFYATWCPPCKMLDEVIYPAPPVVKESKKFINVKIDVDKHQDLMVKYKIEAMPTIVFLDPSGREIHRSPGISDQVSWFVELMQTAHSKAVPTAA